jgi:hypothetical protein
MSLRHPHRIARALLFLMIGGVVTSCVQGEDRPAARRFEFSETNGAELVTNLTEMSSKRNGLTRLEEELNGSFKGLPWQGSSDRVRSLPGGPVPPRPVIQNRRSSDSLDRRKDWVFMTPEEMMGVPKAEDLLEPTDPSREEERIKKLTPMERYFESLGRSSKGSLNGAGVRGGDNLRGTATDNDPLEALARSDQDEEKLPSGIKASEQRLRGLLGNDPNAGAFNPATARGTLSDIFGVGADVSPSREQIRAHEDYMKQYQNLLDGSPSSPVPLNAFNSLAGAPTPAAAGLPVSSIPTETGHYTSLSGVAEVSQVPTSLTDPTTKVLNEWNPYQTPSSPLLDPPKPIQPLPANFDFPRRKF